MIKIAAKTSLSAAVFSGLLLWFWASPNMAITSSASQALLILNLFGLYVLWRVVVVKKSIALGVVIIILKYPLLGYAVSVMARQSWFNGFGVFLGFSVFVAAIVVATTLLRPKETANKNK